jgi:cytoskeleton protein RodZ
VSFGTKLQAERESRGVALSAIAERTRVPERFLNALEQEQFEQMPGGVFNKGILRSYCRDLGLDEDEWRDRFEVASTNEGSPDLAEFAKNVKRTRSESPRGTGIRWWGVMLMLLALGALAWAAWKYVVRPRVLRPVVSSAQTLRVDARPRGSLPS